LAHPPAHNAHGVDINYKGHVLPALPGRDIGEIRDPKWIGLVSMELSIEPIKRPVGDIVSSDLAEPPIFGAIETTTAHNDG